MRKVIKKEFKIKAQTIEESIIVLNMKYNQKSENLYSPDKNKLFNLYILINEKNNETEIFKKAIIEEFSIFNVYFLENSLCI